MKEKVYEEGSCLFTGEDGIGGVIVEPHRPRLGKGWAHVENVGVRPESSTVLAVRAVVRLGSEGRRVICRKAVSSRYLECSRL